MGIESLGKSVLQLATDNSQLDSGLKEAEDKSKSFTSRVGDVLGTGLKVAAGLGAAGIGALTAVLIDSTKGAMDAEKVQADLANVLKTTGGASGMTVDSLNDLSTALSEVTPFEDDVISKGEGMLLTFTNVGKDVFPQATEAMLNMSQKMGTDLSSSAIQLGKALNDPEKGISALTKVGVTFTEQQKEQIKAMQDAGDMAGAQKVILAELDKEFGGVARTAGGTFAGQMTILSNQVGNVKDEIGGAFIPILADLAQKYGPSVIEMVKQLGNWMTTTLIPAISRVVDWLGTNLPPVIATVSNFINTQLIPAIKTIVDWLSINLPPAIETAKQVFGTIQGVINTVVTAMGGASGATKEAGSTFQQVSTIIKLAVELIQTIVTTAFNAISSFIQNNQDGIKTVLTGAWDVIKSVVKLALDIIQGVLTVALDLFKGNWSGAWTDIKNLVGNILNDLKGIIDGELQIVVGIFGGAWQKVSDTANGIFAGLKNSVMGMFNGIVDGIKGSINGAIDAINKSIDLFNRVPGVHISKIPHLAVGTNNFAGGMALVGEYGPELAIMPQGTRVLPNDVTRKIGGDTYNIDARGSSWTEAMFQRQMQLALATVGQVADTRGRMR